MATQPQTRISKAEAAQRLGCSQKTIDCLRHKGELVAVKSSREQQGHVKITLASLEAYEQRQLEAAEPAPAWDDIEKRFPIPELDQARCQRRSPRGSHQGGTMKAPSERQLTQVERDLKKLAPGTQRAVADSSSRRSRSYGLRSVAELLSESLTRAAAIGGSSLTGVSG